MTIPKTTRLALLLGAILSANALPADAAAIISVTPATLTALPGQNFALDVSITGAADLYAFQFDLAFDPAILSASSIIEGALLPSGGTTSFTAGAIDNGTGTVTFTANSLIGDISGVSADGILATINFQALDFGTSAVTLSNWMLLDSTFTDIAATGMDGSVTVSSDVAVPEPSEWLLFATGSIGLWAGSRKKQTA